HTDRPVPDLPSFPTRRSSDLMPLPITLAHRMARRLAEVRRSGELPYLRPDGKTQVTLVYEDGVATALDTVVLSAQHHDGIDLVEDPKSTRLNSSHVKISYAAF